MIVVVKKTDFRDRSSIFQSRLYHIPTVWLWDIFSLPMPQFPHVYNENDNNTISSSGGYCIR